MKGLDTLLDECIYPKARSSSDVRYRIYEKCTGDIPRLKAAKLDRKALALIDILHHDPYQTPPPLKNSGAISMVRIQEG